ncbi:zinc metalloprotease HtpX [Sulfurovum lithotrophicum]|nr:zinc metalloprotease HtpX [Sulfurovum lithotrophicum]
MEQFKTYALMTGLTLLFIWFGGMIAGQTGMIIAFLAAAGMNFYAYYYSDQQVLKHYNAIPVDHKSASGLYHIVFKLTQKADLPMPALYIIPEQQPNAFATGRDYEHAAVAVTQGLLDLMTEEEVEAVIAHELSHIKHYDMLIGTVTATIAGAIAMLANFGMFFGGGDRDRPNFIVMIALMFIMPMAASVIQMTVSRNREFMADEGAAKMTGHPEWLQSALAKLDSYARGTVLPEADPQTAHMFIINPFSGKDMSLKQLFSTHPSTEARIERLEALKH